MRVHELVDRETKRKLNDLYPASSTKPVAKVHPKPKRKRKRKKRPEQLTEADWKYLMGTNRDRYHRVNGKVKRK